MPKKPQLEQEPPSSATVPVAGQNRSATRWLWVLVSSFTLIIAGMWIWATKISLSSFNWNRTPEKKIFDNSKKEWNELFNNEAVNIQNEQMKKKIKNVIEQIMSASSTTSTTPVSTTPPITTATTTY